MWTPLKHSPRSGPTLMAAPSIKNEIKDSPMRIVPHLLGAAITAALISTPVFAAELTGTLKKIKESGTITLGHRDASIPFSYIADASGVPVGYSHDIQLKIVEAIKKDLDMPDLKVKYNLVTSQTRIPLVQNGTVDVECGSTTNNVERQQQVDFSIGIFEVGTRLLSKKDSSYKDFDDLKGKNVVTTAGTTSERILKAMNADKQMGMNVISAKDHGESFQMLESGRAVAFMMDDALLAGEMSGHIFFKERWFGFDDGIYSAARLLEILSQESANAEDLFETFPNDISTPEINIKVTDVTKFSIIKALETDAQWGDAKLTTIDGVRVDYPKGWGLVRASNTTPVLVLRFEAETEAELQRIKDVFHAELKKVAPDLDLPF
nr:transporter substrate-binding domain-containing protein [Pseudomonas syringae]